MTRVLFVTSEVHPLVRTGGLADVSASLPEALGHIGYDINILLPGYPEALKLTRDTGALHKARLWVDSYDVNLWQTRLPGTAVTLWVVDCAQLFGRRGNPYTNSKGQPWKDNARRFQLFAKVGAKIALGKAGLSWTPELVHCNDWQSALLPIYLELIPDRPSTVFTIHNLASQGLFPRDTFRNLGLPEHLWSYDLLEFKGQLAFIKGGLVFSDRITTVSPAYAEEIQHPEFGCGLENLLHQRRHELAGILNGIDTRTWNPENDPHIPHHFGSEDIKSKRLCRFQLQRDLGLEQTESPLFCFVGRLVERKGLDWLLDILPALFRRGCKLALLGDESSHREPGTQESGSEERKYEGELAKLARQWPLRLSVTFEYDEGLAHRITAGSDMLLMPSRFEPCGLNQLYSLRYGTVPIVHQVGGLRDTVFDASDSSSKRPNGFCFDIPDASAFLATIERALRFYENRRAWRRLQENAMTGDYSWNHSARLYSDLYQNILAERQHAIWD